MLEVAPTVGLVLGTSKTLTKDVMKAPPMVGVVSEILAGVFVGFGFLGQRILWVSWLKVFELLIWGPHLC